MMDHVFLFDIHEPKRATKKEFLKVVGMFVQIETFRSDNRVYYFVGKLPIGFTRSTKRTGYFLTAPARAMLQ